VRALVDEGLLASDDAKAAGLVDEVIWPDEAEEWARRVTGRRVRLAGRYEPGRARAAQRWGKRPIIEIVRIDGAIVGGRSRRGLGQLTGAETVAGQLRTAADDRDVKAIVLRIDSPGGDGLASDLIWREVVRARGRKPVIASMGDLAASGGYLAAVGADAIVAEPSTLTGSIGVFAVKPDLSGLLAKLSVEREAYARGQIAQLHSAAKPWTDAERRAVERQIDTFYRLFIERVAAGRRLSPEAVAAVAGGRVWTGRQAAERGLVDRLGSLEDALAMARERAGLGAEEAEVRRTGRGGGPGVLAGALAQAAETPLTRAVASIPEVRALSLLSEIGPVVALPVEWVAPASR
jgi:protease-4